MESADLFYLERCLQLAQIAGANVYPNPRVGSVIVHAGKIIGEGFHAKYGGDHGEVAAVKSVQDKSLLRDSSLYVNLEPCNHFGKTPPCTELILKHNIPRVVIGSLDPNPKVAGSGMEKLREQGVEVLLAPNPQPYLSINKVFFVNQSHKRAYILLKWAESADRFMAGLDESGNPFPTPISSSQSLRLAHKLRAQHHAIMVGRNTAQIDNPRLNTRLFPGKTPIRIILDRKLKLPTQLNIFQDGLHTIILNEKKEETVGRVTYVKTEHFSDLVSLSEELYQRLGICSVMVEGGSELLQQFIDQEAYDEILRVEAKKTLINGMMGPSLPKNLIFKQHNLDGNDQLFHHIGQAYRNLLKSYQR